MASLIVRSSVLLHHKRESSDRRHDTSTSADSRVAKQFSCGDPLDSTVPLSSEGREPAPAGRLLRRATPLVSAGAIDLTSLVGRRGIRSKSEALLLSWSSPELRVLFSCTFPKALDCVGEMYLRPSVHRRSITLPFGLACMSKCKAWCSSQRNNCQKFTAFPSRALILEGLLHNLSLPLDQDTRNGVGGSSTRRTSGISLRVG